MLGRSTETSQADVPRDHPHRRRSSSSKCQAEATLGECRHHGFAEPPVRSVGTGLLRQRALPGKASTTAAAWSIEWLPTVSTQDLASVVMAGTPFGSARAAAKDAIRAALGLLEATTVDELRIAVNTTLGPQAWIEMQTFQAHPVQDRSALRLAESDHGLALNAACERLLDATNAVSLTAAASEPPTPPRPDVEGFTSVRWAADK